jgi:5'-nucleotidase/UDP-sugar diphosphatase
VKWAVGNGITTGTTATTFSPEQTCTQAQILTFLWRAAGKPEAGSTASYANSVITEKQYYYKALQWAAGKGVVTDMALDPNAKCSRSDAALYLWRYAGSPASSPAAFTDVAADSPYAGAVAWAVEKGVTKGTSSTTFSPDSSCTRGQIVTFLYRDLAEE